MSIRPSRPNETRFGGSAGIPACDEEINMITGVHKITPAAYAISAAAREVVRVHDYALHETPPILLAIIESTSDEETEALGRAFLAHYESSRLPAYRMAVARIRWALATPGSIVPMVDPDIDEALALAERPLDTPSLDTSFHDHEMNVDC